MSECFCMSEYAYEYTHSSECVLIENSDVKMFTASLFQISPRGAITLNRGSNVTQLHLGKIWKCKEWSNEIVAM